MDAATDRLGREYERAVEVVRAGTIFAHNAKAHAAWQRDGARRRPGRGLTGEALEAAVMRIGEQFPGSVVYGAAG